MGKQIEFFYDYLSPFSYLADTQLPALAARTGAEIVYRPALLGATMKATNNSGPLVIQGNTLIAAASLGAGKSKPQVDAWQLPGSA